METISTKVEGVIATLMPMVNKAIYVWGRNGINLSAMDDPEAYIRACETTTDFANTAIQMYRDRVAQGVYPIYAFDCSGLMTWSAWQNRVFHGDLSSAGLYRSCTAISKGALKRGDYVFHASDASDPSTVNHVGIYLGNNQVLECRGRAYGCVISTGLSRFNLYGRFSRMFTSADWCSNVKDGFEINDIRWKSNVNSIFNFIKNTDSSYQDEAIIALIGFHGNDSGLNSWHWENNNYVDNTKAYGFFSMKPASDYLTNAVNILGYDPSLSTNEVYQAQSDPAYSYDGRAQTEYFIDTYLPNHWNANCWNSGWGSRDDNVELAIKRDALVSLYGSNNQLTLQQYLSITNVYDALFLLSCCLSYYRTVPSSLTGVTSYTESVYRYVVDSEPIPSSYGLKKMPVWMMIRNRHFI